jgi:ribonuclease R
MRRSGKPGGRARAGKPSGKARQDGGPSRGGSPEEKARQRRHEVAAQIERQLAGSPRGFKTRSLYSLLGRPLPYGEFTALLAELQAAGRLGRGELRRWTASGRAALVEGALSRGRGGHGWLLPEDGSERVFLHRNQLGLHLPDDRLRVQVAPVRGSAGREGRVVALLERRLERLVGRFVRHGTDWLLQPDSLRFGGLIRVRGPLPSGAREGSAAVVELLADPLGETLPPVLWVRILRLLDEHERPALLQERVKAEYNLPDSFPPEVEREAAALDESRILLDAQRIDLRGSCIFTIDPPDAKDYDDAVSIQPLEKGGWELGVHIADVSHFVREGGALDREALRRGCSVYLPGEVVPMLPHRLSSGLCSLAEGVDRCCLSAVMRFSARGVLRELRVFPSLIRSSRRFSYDEVQTILEGFPARRPAGWSPEQAWPGDPIRVSLYYMDRLWRLLKRRRLAEGGLDFALPEPVFDLDEHGMPLAVRARVSREANFLVEEFMLAANRAVAERLARERRGCLYRVHDPPSGTKLERFRDTLEHLGVRPIPDLGTVAGWRDLVASFAGSDRESLLQQLVLRSMMKALYSPVNSGHFGLGFERYCHFTSPIRRYPDLVVHRELRKWLQERQGLSRAALEEPARQAVRRELTAMEAEREAVRSKQLLFLERRVGDEFSGLVRGVERFGAFVELVDVLADGLIPLAELPGGGWDYDERSWELRSRRGNRCIRLGDRLTVQLLRVDVEAREVDLRWVDEQRPEDLPSAGKPAGRRSGLR